MVNRFLAARERIALWFASTRLPPTLARGQVADYRRSSANRSAGSRALRWLLQDALPETTTLNLCLGSESGQLDPFLVTVGHQRVHLQLAVFWTRAANSALGREVAEFAKHWAALLRQGSVTSSFERPDLVDFLVAALLLPGLSGLAGPAPPRRRPTIGTLGFSVLSQLAIAVDQALPMVLGSRGQAFSEQPPLLGPSGVPRRLNQVIYSELATLHAKRLRKDRVSTLTVCEELETRWNTLYNA